MRRASWLRNGAGVSGADARTRVMGVLNVTPDSFSDGGEHFAADSAIAHGLRLVAEGADLIDVGGESTRPGAAPVSVEEEQRRVLPVIEALAAAGATVSIDTLHAATAEAAAAVGARFVNDVSGGLHDPEMLRTVARLGDAYGASLIAGHWRGIPDPGHQRSGYRNVVAEVREALAARAGAAREAGIDPDRVILDPGLGFDKTAEQGWQLLAGLEALTSLGHPVLVGASRKRMLSETLAARDAAAGIGGSDAATESAPAPAPLTRLDAATAVVSAFAGRAGAWGVRVHDVRLSADALAVESALAGAETRPAVGGFRRMPVDLPGDRIALRGLEVFAHHGVFDFERRDGQRFLIDAELSVDLRAAAQGDELARTVHYGELAEAIVAAVGRDPVDLIETVAERVAGVALGFAGVAEVRATVHKPDAPIDARFADVSVSVTRRPAPPAPGGGS